MVQFGEKLRANKVVEWADKYVDYKALKQIINEISKQKRALEEAAAAEILDDDQPAYYTSDGIGGSKSASERDSLLGTPNRKWAERTTEQSKISMGLNSAGSDDSDDARAPPKVVRYGAVGADPEFGLRRRKTSFSESYADLDKPYEDRIASESEKVEAFYKEKVQIFKERYDHLRPHTAEEDALEKGIHAQYSLKRAFIDLYRQMNFLTNYCILNYTAFVKICKKHDKIVGLRTKKRMINTFIHKREFFKFAMLQRYMGRLERLFADTFCSRNLTVARSELLMKHTPENDYGMLQLGLRLGVTFILFLWVLWVGVIDAYTEPSQRQLGPALVKVYRGMGCLVLGFWLWGVTVYMWSQARVNYIYLFELNPKRQLHWMDIILSACGITTIYLINILVYFKISRDELFGVPRYVADYMPLAMIGYFCMYAFTSWGIVGTGLFTTLWEVGIAPFGTVTFFTAFIGDILTSMVRPFVDIAFTLCFYFTGEWKRHGASASAKELAKESIHVCRDGFIFSNIVVPMVISLPLWWRFAQNLRRYYDTRKRTPHLPNALKYAISHTIVLFGALHAEFGRISSKGTTAYQIMWIIAFGISTLYTFSWDVVMDWGLGRRSDAFLRKELMYRKKHMYYLAMFFDFFLRFAWCLTLLPHGALVDVTSDWVRLTLAAGELLRRMMWSWFRVEYEHLSNTQGYRRVDFIPLYFDTPIERGKQAALRKKKRKWAVLGEVGFMISLLGVMAAIAFFTK